MKRVAALVALGLATLVVGTAGAAPKNFTHATGEIWMSGPDQYAQFEVFDYGAIGDRGSFTYTNFEYPGGLSYTADITCANVDTATGTARFAFTIPAGFPGLSGLIVGVQITDDGSPGAGNDTYGHAVVADANAFCNAGGAVGDYPITAGNLVVH
jgi:hypothetical protein